MKKIYVLLTMLVLFCSSTFSQTITIPPNPWSYSDAQAANVYLSAREDFLTDTIINIHIGTSVKWANQRSKFYQVDTVINRLAMWSTGESTPRLVDTVQIINIINTDSLWTYNFSVDSIVGRGDLRQVLLTTKFKTSNRFGWYITKERYHLASSKQGTVYDTLGTTKDSTTQNSTWLWYTTRLNPVTASSGIGVGKFLVWDIFQNGVYGKLKIWLEKVLGNPETMNGQNQIAKLHFLVEEEPPQIWINKYLNGQ
jgi:hypothetical protein